MILLISMIIKKIPSKSATTSCFPGNLLTRASLLSSRGSAQMPGGMASAGEDTGFFTVTVRGRARVAHSFAGEAFGPARALHGITYTVDAVLTGPALAPHVNYLVDICEAERALQQALATYDRRNLDEIPEFSGQNTTCERVARAVWERMATALPGPPALTSIKIVVRESDVAFVEYERALGPDAPPGLYTVSVRARFMAARSLRGGRFGPGAERLHGATFIVDAQIGGRVLDPELSFLVDICLAEQLLSDAVGKLHQTNLDESMGGAGAVNPTSGAIADVLGSALADGLADWPLESLRLVVRASDVDVSEHVRPLGGDGGDGGRGGGRGGGGGGGGGGGVVPSHTLVARGRCMVAHSFRGEEFGDAQVSRYAE